MGRTSYSPYPSVDSASDYAPEPTTTVTKRRPRGSMTAEERREARAHRNRLAAQSSRDRKKANFDQLSVRVTELEDENRSLRLGIGRSSSSSSSSADPALLKENAELRVRIEQLEQAWQNITKLLGSMALPLPGTSPMHQLQSSSPSSRQPFMTLPTLPLSPAATSPTSPSLSTSNSDMIDAVTEPTCELARFANASKSSQDLEVSLQRVAPSSRSSIIRLLSEQNQWERPRCTTLEMEPPLTASGPRVMCY